MENNFRQLRDEMESFKSDLKAEIQVLRSSVADIENAAATSSGKIDSLEESNKALSLALAVQEQAVDELRTQLKKEKEKVLHLEEYSRRENLIFRNIPERHWCSVSVRPKTRDQSQSRARVAVTITDSRNHCETSKTVTIATLSKLFRHLGTITNPKPLRDSKPLRVSEFFYEWRAIIFDIIAKEMDIETSQMRCHAVHRMGKSTQGRPRPIIVRFVCREDKENVFRNRNQLKESLYYRDAYITLDYPSEIQDERSVLIKAMLKARASGKQAKVIGRTLKIENAKYSNDNVPKELLE
ncbi:uncharacterized protein LOC144645861 [Oculina patagonica]